MNLITFSFVLVTLIDALPLDKTPEALIDSTNSSADWWLWGPSPTIADYVIGSMLNDSQIAAHIGLQLYTKSDTGVIINTSLAGAMPLNAATKAIIANTFDSNVKTIWQSHGFNDNSGSCNHYFVNKFLNVLEDDYQVVCIDWSHWAHQDWNLLDIYRTQARQCIDVGDYLGRYLTHFVTESGIGLNNLHLIGHSLGAHIVGLMGRTFTRLKQTNPPSILPRVTGLDPAGPLFVRNEFGIRTHMIKASDARFVDIVHTNGGMTPHAATIFRNSRLGDLHQLGHADFYPNGGEMQPQCFWHWPGIAGRSACAHNSAVEYYVESIDTNPNAFNTILCGGTATGDDAVMVCNRHTRGSLGNDPAQYNGNNHMGFYAVKPATPTLYFLDIDSNGEYDNPAHPYSVCCSP